MPASLTSDEKRGERGCAGHTFTASPLNSIAPKAEKNPLAPRVVVKNSCQFVSGVSKYFWSTEYYSHSTLLYAYYPYYSCHASLISVQRGVLRLLCLKVATYGYYARILRLISCQVRLLSVRSEAFRLLIVPVPKFVEKNISIFSRHYGEKCSRPGLQS